MIAVFVNSFAVIIGSIIGIAISRKVTDAYADSIQTAAGIISIIIGIQMSFQYQNVVYLAFALIAGGILGTRLDIDGKILALGRFIEKIVFKKNKATSTDTSTSTASASTTAQSTASNKNFAYAFLNASVLFCVGAMAIVGSFRAAIEHDYTIIFTKSVLDGFMAITFSAAMGIGTAFSAVSIFVYQGALTILSVAISPYVTEQMISELTGVGGATIIMIGINLTRLRTIKTANFLPSLVFSALLVLADPFISRCLVFHM